MPCIACCQGWLTGEVLGHDVRPGHPCPHVSANGCGVYERRPEVPCRRFICSWLVEDSPLPDWMRPDLSGVIVLLSQPWEGERIISAVPVGKAVPNRALNWLKEYAQEHARPLIFYERTVDAEGLYTGLKRFGFGPPAFREKVASFGTEAEQTAVPMKSE